MIRRISLLLALALLAAVLAGCGAGETKADAPAAARRLHIVATIFPAYDWTRQILTTGAQAGEVELTLLLDDGVDPHSFQPTVKDMAAIAQCDLFLYVGGESDAWVPDALAGAVNPSPASVNFLEVLGNAVKEEETVEGMREKREGGDAEEGPDYDEHVWLSLRNAGTLCRAIADALGEADPDYAEIYAANAGAYIERLDALDESFRAAVREAPLRTLLFADRFPFRYLTDDYGLTYYAAFPGCSAETEASFETVVFLAEKLETLGLPAVLTIENSDGRLARTILETAAAQDAEVLALDSLQSTTLREAESGKTYLDAMTKNLEVLKRALGAEN